MNDDLRFIAELRRQLVTAAGRHLGRSRLRLPGGRSRGAVWLTTALIVILGVVLPVRWLTGLKGNTPPAAQQESVSSTPVSPPSTAGHLSVTTYKVQRGITGVGYGFGSVWVGGPQQIYRIDAGTGKVVATIPFNGDTYTHIAVGSSAVWATNGSASVSEIDPNRNAIVGTLDVGGGVRGLTVGGGEVWASSEAGSGQLVEISPSTNAVTNSVAVPAGPIQYSGGLVWVFGGSTTTEVNATTMAIQTSSVSVSGPAVVDGNYIWSISSGSSQDASGASVVETDIQTGMQVNSVSVPRAAALATDSSGVWVLSTPGSKSDQLYIPDPKQPAVVTLIDSGTGALIGTPVPVDITPAQVAVGAGSLWISHYETGEVTRVDVVS